MNSKKTLKIVFFLTLSSIFLNGCNGKLPGGDARKTPADPAKRIEQNIKERRGFKLNDAFKKSGGVFDFANANELWRASLDTIDFMPLASVNYSGGIIITDWYSDGSSNESIKITIKFLDTEVRVDAMIIDIHKKICNASNNCRVNKIDTKLNFEIRDKILKKAAVYAKELKERINKDRPKKLYPGDAGPDKY